MKAKARKACPNCRRLQALLDAQEARLKRSRPPSHVSRRNLPRRGRIPRPPPSRPLLTSSSRPSRSCRRVRNDAHIGGQPGHPKHERDPFPPESINGASVDYRLDLCPCCGRDLQPMPTIEPRVIQQVDIKDVRLEIQEHRGHPGWCSACWKEFPAPLPIGIERGGLVGPRLTTLIAYLKGVCHASFSTVRKFIRDVVGLTISRGQLAKIIAKVSEALKEPYEELLASLPEEERLNVDETGHKQNRLRHVDLVLPGQSVHALQDRPDAGRRGVDRGAGQGIRRGSGVRLLLGLSQVHGRVRRDGAVLPGPPDPRREVPDDAARTWRRATYGDEGCGRRCVRSFGVIHRREQLDAPAVPEPLEAARAEVRRCATSNVPATQPRSQSGQAVPTHGESYFRFITTPGVEPTNNLAEQAIRFVVIDRLITQGTRSEKGHRWCERIWTVIATCTQQGQSVFEYLEAAVGAWFADTEPPMLLPGI